LRLHGGLRDRSRRQLLSGRHARTEKNSRRTHERNQDEWAQCHARIVAEIASSETGGRIRA
jgi:hypothetical protein